MTITQIRLMIAEGYTDEQINEMIQDDRAAAAEDRDRYGEDDYDDGLTSAQREYNDRLDMGRNEAGEWLGFM